MCKVTISLTSLMSEKARILSETRAKAMKVPEVSNKLGKCFFELLEHCDIRRGVTTHQSMERVLG